MMFSFVLCGIGLLLLMTGKSMPLPRVAFFMIFEVCLLKLRSLSMVTPWHFACCDHVMLMLLMISYLIFVKLLVLYSTATVFVAFASRRHCLSQLIAVLSCC